MRLYTVGDPVRYLHTSMFSDYKPREFSKNELLAEALNKETVMLFSNFDEAKAYSRSLRETRRGHTMSQYVSRNKVAPVFTLEIADDLDFGKLDHRQEKINFKQINSNDDTPNDKGQEEKMINYHVCGIECIKNAIVRAELPDTLVKTVEFNDQPANCLVM